MVVMIKTFEFHRNASGVSGGQSVSFWEIHSPAWYQLNLSVSRSLSPFSLAWVKEKSKYWHNTFDAIEMHARPLNLVEVCTLLSLSCHLRRLNKSRKWVHEPGPIKEKSTEENPISQNQSYAQESGGWLRLVKKDTALFGQPIKEPLSFIRCQLQPTFYICG